MNFDNRLFKHIYSFLSGDHDRIGKSIVDRWYDSFNDSRGFFDKNQKIKKSEHRDKLFSQIEESIHENNSQKADESRKRIYTNQPYYLGIAALLLVGILLSLFVLNWPVSDWSEPKADEFTIVTSDIGEVIDTQLPDGSTVWLSTDSRIQYSNNFNDDERIITLQGEAYFDVIHSPEKPFIVNSGDVQARVLGTSFIVKSYPNEPTKVTLATGKISVSAQGETQESILTENQQITYSKTTGFRDLKSVDASLELAWKDKELIFMRESFLDIARTFERWYDVEFVFEDPSLKEEVFVYHFKEYSLHKSMKVLNQMASFDYEILDTRVIIDSKK
jgi:ferric-dicitrate binding protein FerR (iron transport regulator)